MYIPPFKLARMMQEVQDKSTPEYQRLTWEVRGLVLWGINGLTGLGTMLPAQAWCCSRPQVCASTMPGLLCRPSRSPSTVS